MGASGRDKAVGDGIGGELCPTIMAGLLPLCGSVCQLLLYYKYEMRDGGQIRPAARVTAKSRTWPQAD